MASPEELLEFLPGLDCGECGGTCAEFAARLCSQAARPEDCPVLHTPDFAGFIEALQELVGIGAPAAPAMVVDPEKCNGCGICVVMCEHHVGNCPEVRLGRGPRAGERVIFKVVNGLVQVVHQELCVRMLQAAEKCSKCAEHCPTGAISFG